MGRLIYAGSTTYEMDDEMLAHVRAVATAKLRRHECFLISWVVDLHAGSGRVSLWASPAIPIEYSFSTSRVQRLDEQWLRVLSEMSNTPRGLVLISREEAAKIAAGEPVPVL